MIVSMGIGGGGSTETPLSTTYYYYNEEGNVTNVVTDKVNPLLGEPKFHATRLEYAANGRAVTYVLGETWGNEQQHEITYAREFRYGERSERERAAIGKASSDVRVRAATCPQEVSTKRATGGAARQRYLNRDLDPVTLQPTLSTWSDYDGNSVCECEIVKS